MGMGCRPSKRNSDPRTSNFAKSRDLNLLPAREKSTLFADRLADKRDVRDGKFRDLTTVEACPYDISQFNAFSTATATYRQTGGHGTERITVRLSTDGTTLEIEHVENTPIVTPRDSPTDPPLSFPSRCQSEPDLRKAKRPSRPKHIGQPPDIHNLKSFRLKDLASDVNSPTSRNDDSVRRRDIRGRLLHDERCVSFPYATRIGEKLRAMLSQTQTDAQTEQTTIVVHNKVSDKVDDKTSYVKAPLAKFHDKSQDIVPDVDDRTTVVISGVTHTATDYDTIHDTIHDTMHDTMHGTMHDTIHDNDRMHDNDYTDIGYTADSESECTDVGATDRNDYHYPTQSEEDLFNVMTRNYMYTDSDEELTRNYHCPILLEDDRMDNDSYPIELCDISRDYSPHIRNDSYDTSVSDIGLPRNYYPRTTETRDETRSDISHNYQQKVRQMSYPSTSDNDDVITVNYRHTTRHGDVVSPVYPFATFKTRPVDVCERQSQTDGIIHVHPYGDNHVTQFHTPNDDVIQMHAYTHHDVTNYYPNTQNTNIIQVHPYTNSDPTQLYPLTSQNDDDTTPCCPYTTETDDVTQSNNAHDLALDNHCETTKHTFSDDDDDNYNDNTDDDNHVFISRNPTAPHPTNDSAVFCCDLSNFPAPVLNEVAIVFANNDSRDNLPNHDNSDASNHDTATNHDTQPTPPDDQPTTPNNTPSKHCFVTDFLSKFALDMDEFDSSNCPQNTEYGQSIREGNEPPSNTPQHNFSTEFSSYNGC